MHPSVFEVGEFDSAIQFLIGSHPGLQEAIRDLIDFITSCIPLSGSDLLMDATKCMSAIVLNVEKYNDSLVWLFKLSLNLYA